MILDELAADKPDIEPQYPRPATDHQKTWRREGVLILKQFLPDELIEAYCVAHEREGLGKDWQDATPYMRVPELLDLCTYEPLSKVLEEILLEPAGLHLNLTGWVSTERDWHQDAYLSPDHVGSFYAAVWIALADIHPDSGPFEWIPKSHKWPLISRDKVRARIPEHLRDHPSWPKHSEEILTPAIEEKIKEENLPVKKFIAKKGDVLIWHARIVHRGSLAKVPGMERKALIAHYSGLNHREDMAAPQYHIRAGLNLSDSANVGGWFFPFDDKGRARGVT